VYTEQTGIDVIARCLTNVTGGGRDAEIRSFLRGYSQEHPWCFKITSPMAWVTKRVKISSCGVRI